jgi:putative spermidine/putrescine transport system permease protein
MREARGAAFYWLALLFALFVLFLYGPMVTIVLLSFQGPEGGLTFPMNGASLHWFRKLWEGLGVVDIWAAFRRSLWLGLVVMGSRWRSRCWPGSRSASAFAARPCCST